MSSRTLRVLLQILLFVSMCSASSPKSADTSFDYARIPLLFEKNIGQVDARYSFVLNRPGMKAGFDRSGVTFQLLNKSGQYVSIPLRFESSSASAVEGQDALESKVNYLLGSDSKRWKTNVSAFGKLRYESVFSGVDLLFYGNGQEMEHDFIVRPGADPASIGMSAGEAKIKITSTGDAYISNGDAVLKLQKPVAYQQTPSGRIEVAANFSLKGNRLGFKIGSYRHDLPLVIDPAVSFSTYLANGDAIVSGVATDTAGNTFVVGYTFASNFPLVNPFQSTCVNCSSTPDVFVVKLNPTGTGVLYSTYIGGSQYDEPVGIRVDASGNAVIAGRTSSADYPLHNQWPDSSSQGQTFDGFLTSLSPDGASLNYSTFLGHAIQGYANDTAVTALALGSDGAAYVTGSTGDANFPTTSGTMKNATPGYPTSPVFLTKFSSTGTVVYSAIVGNTTSSFVSSGPASITGIAVDSSGAAYLAGRASPGWPITAGAYQSSITSEASVVVSKVSADASSFVYSTFIGNSGNAQVGAIALDSTGAAFITGSYADNNYPLTTVNLGFDADSSTPPEGRSLLSDCCYCSG